MEILFHVHDDQNRFHLLPQQKHALLISCQSYFFHVYQPEILQNLILSVWKNTTSQYNILDIISYRYCMGCFSIVICYIFSRNCQDTFMIQFQRMNMDLFFFGRERRDLNGEVFFCSIISIASFSSIFFRRTIVLISYFDSFKTKQNTHVLLLNQFSRKEIIDLKKMIKYGSSKKRRIHRQVP